MKTKFVALAALLFAALLVFGCTSTQVIPVVDGNLMNVEVKLIDSSGALVQDKNISALQNDNVFDLMKNNFDINYTSYAIGPFINSIKGLDFNSDYYLSLYVDGNMADKGINSYTVEKDMLIEWKVMSIASFGLS